MTLSVFLTALGLLAGLRSCVADYQVVVERLSSHPSLSGTLLDSNSAFTYTYNPALYTTPDGQIVVVPRCQNRTSSGGVGPSQIAKSPFDLKTMTSANVQISDVILNSTESYEKCGTEDPRMIQSGNTWYLFYTAYDCSKAALAVASTETPGDYSSWVKHGPIFLDIKWSKSGAAIVRDSAPHYLIWGDSSLVPGLHVSTSTDLIHWSDPSPTLLIETRSNSWDSDLVESGPPPLRLQSGDYFFIYNSARVYKQTVKPGWNKQYNAGFVILDGQDPTTVKQRSVDPILSPSLSWEVGNSSQPLFLTPEVVFVEGMIRDPEAGEGEDSFLIFYGAADSVVGVARVTVTNS